MAGQPSDDLAPDTLNSILTTGGTVKDTEQAIREAIEFHLVGMRKYGNPVPPPSSRVEYIEVAA